MCRHNAGMKPSHNFFSWISITLLVAEAKSTAAGENIQVSKNGKGALHFIPEETNSSYSHSKPCFNFNHTSIPETHAVTYRSYQLPLERNELQFKNFTLPGNYKTLTKINNLCSDIKHPIKRPPKNMTFRKRKQTNRIRHQMQSSFRRGRQMNERTFLKVFDPPIHQTQNYPIILTPSYASKKSGINIIKDMEINLSSKQDHDNHLLSRENGLRSWQMQRSLPRMDDNKEPPTFNKPFSLETSKKSLKYPGNQKYLNKREEKKDSSLTKERVKAIGEVNERLSDLAHQSLPVVLPLHSKSPNITWGRAHNQNAAFADPNPVNVTARDGEQARLPCTVLGLEQGKVSWIRKRDLHILTVGRSTYTSDQRFRVLHGEGSLDWTLIIGPTTLRDAGTYECQVSTKTKISRPVNLIISVERAEIQGPKEIYIRNGSTISLTCIVKSKSEDLGSVLWTKEGITLDYDSPRGGISLEVEKTPTKATTKLFITKARKRDSGTYICSPQFAQPASVIVHVVNGEESRAVQTNNSAELKSCIIALSISLLLSIKSFHLQLSPSPLSIEYLHMGFLLPHITSLPKWPKLSIFVQMRVLLIFLFILLLMQNIQFIIHSVEFVFSSLYFFKVNYLSNPNERFDQITEPLHYFALFSTVICGLEICIQFFRVCIEITQRDLKTHSDGEILKSCMWIISERLIKKTTSRKDNYRFAACGSNTC